MEIHLIDVELFQSGLKWWTDQMNERYANISMAKQLHPGLVFFFFCWLHQLFAFCGNFASQQTHDRFVHPIQSHTGQNIDYILHYLQLFRRRGLIFYDFSSSYFSLKLHLSVRLVQPAVEVRSQKQRLLLLQRQSVPPALLLLLDLYVHLTLGGFMVDLDSTITDTNTHNVRKMYKAS